MIRINLNRTRVTSAVEGETNVDEGAGGGGPDIREIGVKLFVMFLGVLSLYIYERQNIDALNQELAKQQVEVNAIKQQLTEKQAELAKLKDIEPLAQGLNDKLRALRDYSRQRITQLQSLDFMQSIIPERVWLRSIHFDHRRYQILGNSVETVDLTDFVNKLENSAYFKDVIVIQDKEKPLQTGKIRDFELSAREQAYK